MIALRHQLVTVLKGRMAKPSLPFPLIPATKAPLWLTYGNTDLDLNGASQRVRSLCFLLIDLTSVEVAKVSAKKNI